MSAASTVRAASVFDGTPGYFTGNGVTDGLAWNGTPAFATDNFAGASGPQSFSLDGATTLTDPDPTVGNLGTGDFALGVHFKTTQGGANIALLSKQADCSGQGSWLQVDLANSGVYVQDVSTTSAEEFTGVTGAALNDGAWHFVELVRSGATLYLFIDGLQRASVPFSGPNPFNTAPLTLGGGVCASPISSGAHNVDLQGELSTVYVGPGSTYTLNLASGTPTVPAGGQGSFTVGYHNDLGYTMSASVHLPAQTTLTGLYGPGCTQATASCSYPLQGNGAPITPAFVVSGSATPGSTLSGGSFTMTDLALPLDPSSTGWDPATGAATLPLTVNVATINQAPLVSGPVAGAALAGGVLVGLGGLITRRRRRQTIRA